jgi:YfiH family protein
MNLDVPTIFPSNITAGLTQANFAIHPDLKKGLNFRAIESEDFELSKKLLAKNLNTNLSRLHFINQVHGNKIKILTKENLDLEDEEQYDGLMTNLTDQVLCVKVGDCCGVLLHDPVQQVISALHSGRKGTEQNIAGIAAQMMTQKFGSKPADILAYLSASLGQRSYLIFPRDAKLWDDKYKQTVVFGSSPEVAHVTQNEWILQNYLEKYNLERDEIYKEQYILNLPQRIVDQLLEAGLRLENIEVSPTDTYRSRCHHSYRRQAPDHSLMTAFIEIKPEIKK